MAEEKKPLIPATQRKVYRDLNPEIVKHLTVLADASEHRQAQYARLGMICGTFAFSLCIGGFIYLIMKGHDIAASTLLGTAVLGLLGKIFKARL